VFYRAIFTFHVHIKCFQFNSIQEYSLINICKASSCPALWRVVPRILWPQLDLGINTFHFRSIQLPISLMPLASSVPVSPWVLAAVTMVTTVHRSTTAIDIVPLGMEYYIPCRDRSVLMQLYTYDRANAGIYIWIRRAYRLTCLHADRIYQCLTQKYGLCVPEYPPECPRIVLCVKTGLTNASSCNAVRLLHYYCYYHHRQKTNIDMATATRCHNICNAIHRSVSQHRFDFRPCRPSTWASCTIIYIYIYIYTYILYQR